MKRILVLVLLTFAFSGCEKDDICDANTSVTPRVIIEFYDATQTSVLKNVVNLEVHATDETEALPLFNGVSKIQLPLNPIAETTSYTLNLNSTLVGSANTDSITFNYTTKQVYVSRACGFKNVYELNSLNGALETDGATPDGMWITDLDVITNNILNENEVHIKIYY